jgi:hypothetical protein
MWLACLLVWPSADFDTLSTIFEFYLQTLPFNAARTLSYFNHTGIFYTETKTLFGAFAVSDYGANASTRTPPKTLPPYLESNGYIHYDYGTITDRYDYVIVVIIPT